MTYSVERLILTELSKSGGNLALYSLHRRYTLTPGTIFKSVQSLSRKSLISVDDLFIKLTKSGIQYLFTNRETIASSTELPWRTCPTEFQQSKISINEPYIPIRSKLDKTFFKFHFDDFKNG